MMPDPKVPAGVSRNLPEGDLVDHEQGQKELAKRSRRALQNRTDKVRARRLPSELDLSEAKAALEISNGIMRGAADLLQVDYGAFRSWLNRNDEMLSFRLELKERIVDSAEQKMIGLTRSGEPHVVFKSAAFILRTLGGDRGWREQKEVTVSAKDLATIKNAVQALILNFVPAEKQTDSMAYFVQQVRDEMSGGRQSIADDPLFQKTKTPGRARR